IVHANIRPNTIDASPKRVFILVTSKLSNADAIKRAPAQLNKEARLRRVRSKRVLDPPRLKGFKVSRFTSIPENYCGHQIENHPVTGKPTYNVRHLQFVLILREFSNNVSVVMKHIFSITDFWHAPSG